MAVNEAEMQILEKTEQRWIGQIPRNDNQWDWHPFPIREFRAMLEIAINIWSYSARLRHDVTASWPPSFLDASCGIGSKIWLAKRDYPGIVVHGVDINPQYIQAARDEFGLNGTEVALGDSLSYPDYNMFDIVYMSRPIRDDMSESVYERSVLRQVKPGAIVIASWAAVKPHWPYYYRGPNKYVARKLMPDESYTPPPLAPSDTR
jgi:2-polyprenyl-3-methyl-5-hydroxy-6-metoxy-1,4-benzoquinol methylase